MRDFFARTPDGDDTPVDVAQVRADEALIEALRQTPLFGEPVDAPIRWMPSVDADSRSGAGLPGFGTSEDYEDFVRPAAGGADDSADSDQVASDAQVAALLRAWRDEIDAVPLPPPPDARIAMAVIRSAPQHRRSVRPMIAVAAAIAGLLMGSTAIGARSASPDDTLLWPVTQLLWGDRVEEINASIQAREGIDEAAKAIDAGHPDAAEAALDHVTVVITKVGDSSVEATLRSDLNRVQSQLESSRATPSAGTPVSTTPSAAGNPTTVPTIPPNPPIAPTSAPDTSAPVVPPVSEQSSSSSEAPSEPSVPPAPDPSVDEPEPTPEPTPTDPTAAEPTPDATPSVTPDPATSTSSPEVTAPDDKQTDQNGEQGDGAPEPATGTTPAG